MADLRPTIGGDNNDWGAKLFAWLDTSIAIDGTLLPAAVTAAGFADAAGPSGPIGDANNIPVITTGPNGEIQAISSVPIASQPLVPLSTAQTADFTATPFTLCPVDLSAASVVATLPDAPEDSVAIGFTVAVIGSSKTLTITSGTGDGIQVPGSAATRVIGAQDDTRIYQYNQALAVWYRLA